MGMIQYLKLFFEMSTYILQIDTATDICSVSLSLDGKCVYQIEAKEPNLHASQLTVFIDQLMKESCIDYASLSAVCVSKGPGSYTGLRIGVSTAKGLCYVLDIPLLAINTLDMMFLGYKLGEDTKILYVPMLDARRMEVYLEIFDARGKKLVDTTAQIIDEDSFEDYADSTLVLFGTGANKLEALFHDQDRIIVDNSYIHSSSYMSTAAFEKFQTKDFEDLVYFEPYYLKEFIATTPKKLL